MSIWIVTTGNSDVILKNDLNWNGLYTEIQYNLDCTGFASPIPIDPYNQDAGYTVPARVLGQVYETQPDYYQEDLKFPLFDTYREYFDSQNIKPEKIIILLTDQSAIFHEEKRIYEKCPYWQDTCTLKNLFEWYFKNNFNCLPEFVYLKPQSGKGIDHWNETLSLVEESFRTIEDNSVKTVYVSHQAGTPAISSAVQFISLGKFKKVNFLVSNQFFDDNYEQQAQAEAIESSNYWRGMQIQKAKQLITAGFPGSAIKILEGIGKIDNSVLTELEKLVDFFNINSLTQNRSEDFEIAKATQRIVDALDLIGIFFNQQSYLQGITLLAAAQETFLKVGIISKVASINDTITLNGQSHKVNQFIEWNPRGLFLNLSLNNQSIQIKTDILHKLRFPVTRVTLNSEKDFEVTNKNFALLLWLNKLDPHFSGLEWGFLKYYCNKKDSENDIRNQLMHNLRGVEVKEVIDYLSVDKNHPNTNLMEVYNTEIKQPFMNAINYFQLPYTREKLNKKLQKIADSLD